MGTGEEDLLGGRVVAVLALHAVAFGLAEAAIARYLFAILAEWGIPDPLALRTSGSRVMAEVPSWFMPTEGAREAATFAMLGAVAWLVSVSYRTFVGALLWLFGMWEFSFYVFKVMLFQPVSSVLDWDCLLIFPFSLWLPTYVPIAVSIAVSVLGYRLMRGLSTHEPT